MIDIRLTNIFLSTSGTKINERKTFYCSETNYSKDKNVCVIIILDRAP